MSEGPLQNYSHASPVKGNNQMTHSWEITPYNKPEHGITGIINFFPLNNEYITELDFTLRWLSGLA